MAEDTETCKGTTKSGDPCKQPASDKYDGYCYAHRNDADDEDDEEDEPVDEEEEITEEDEPEPEAEAEEDDEEDEPDGDDEDDDEPETVHVSSGEIGYAAPGVRFESTREVKEVELTAAIEEALEDGRLERMD